MTLVAATSLFFIMLTLAAVPSASVALVVVRSASGGLRHGLAVTTRVLQATSGGLMIGTGSYLILKS